MSNNLCTSCGAELVAGARFCRRCGQSLDPQPRPSVTEATTRVLQNPVADAPSTEHFDVRPTGPSYIAPGEMSGMQPQATGGLAARGKSSRLPLLLLLAFLLMVFAALGVGAYVLLRSSASAPVVAKPARPVVPPPTSVNPPDVPPPPPVSDEGGSPIGSELVYPGAKTTMDMTRGGEGGIRQLQTGDSFDKVLAWYKTRINPVDTIDVRSGQNAVLRGDKVTAVISEEDGMTNILLTVGVDR